MHGDKECLFSGVTNYGRVWRKGAGKQGMESASHQRLKRLGAGTGHDLTCRCCGDVERGSVWPTPGASARPIPSPHCHYPLFSTQPFLLTDFRTEFFQNCL